ncbi:hypothetical protein BC830DRAFT_1084431 [Chytriomyces sp. MP71]|nr:hypothetical protein BC830DRAFT_1084431 [Chytriomyces sp. MP71]
MARNGIFFSFLPHMITILASGAVAAAISRHFCISTASAATKETPALEEDVSQVKTTLESHESILRHIQALLATVKSETVDLHTAIESLSEEVARIQCALQEEVFESAQTRVSVTTLRGEIVRLRGAFERAAAEEREQRESGDATPSLRRRSAESGVPISGRREGSVSAGSVTSSMASSPTSSVAVGEERLMRGIGTDRGAGIGFRKFF